MDVELEFMTLEAFEGWLARNHAKSGGVWLRVGKKSGGPNIIKGSEVLDALLCYGWITGQARRGDKDSVLWWVCPRRKGSLWSKLNRGRALLLMKEGRMRPSGLKEVEEARKDGRWARAYSPQSTARIPADFMRELRKDKDAHAFFSTLDKANRYAIIFRVTNSKRRKEKIADIIGMLREKRAFHQGSGRTAKKND